MNRKALKEVAIPFDKVKIGDIAVDYANDKFKVVDKGTLGMMLKRYPNNSSCMPEEEYESMGISLDDPALVMPISHKTLEGYTHHVYPYGPHGALVLINQEV